MLLVYAVSQDDCIQERGGCGGRQILCTFYLHYPREFSLQPCNGSITVLIIKMSQERSGKASYLFKVR